VQIAHRKELEIVTPHKSIKLMSTPYQLLAYARYTEWALLGMLVLLPNCRVQEMLIATIMRVKSYTQNLHV